MQGQEPASVPEPLPVQAVSTATCRARTGLATASSSWWLVRASAPVVVQPSEPEP